MNFNLTAINYWKNSDLAYTNTRDFTNQLAALRDANGGQFSCLQKILDSVAWEWILNNSATAGYGADDWLYRAIQAKWGFVNQTVRDEIYDPNINYTELQPPNMDKSQSKLFCSAWNGGDGERPSHLNPDGVTAHVNNQMCATGTVYLRPNANGWCEAFDPATDPALQRCGSADLNYSEITPISLLWSPKLNLDNFDSEIHLVKFALDLRDTSDSFYEWKASGEAPLLVYDPEHTGEVKSASQLFGSWSFGGKGGSKFDSNRERWTDGYEALETQDLDRDGKIRGTELDSIALWFDRNRDAVSQPGEVVSARKAGLVELYYREPSGKQADGSRHLSLGFRRKDGSGLLFSGSSVDWTARSAEFGQTLFEGDLVRPGKSGGGLSIIQSASKSSAPQQTGLPQAVASEIGGYWRWANGISSNPATGILFLRANQDGSVQGSTVSESVKMDTMTGDKVHTVRFVSVQGELDGKDRSKVTFSMVLPDNGQSARSTAALFEENGKTYLKGTTEASITTPDGSKRVVSYNWMAERLTTANRR